MGETGNNGAVLSAEHNDVWVAYQIKRVTHWQVGEVLVAHRVSELLYVGEHSVAWPTYLANEA
jgi:hypothetical protein